MDVLHYPNSYKWINTPCLYNSFTLTCEVFSLFFKFFCTNSSFSPPASSHHSAWKVRNHLPQKHWLTKTFQKWKYYLTSINYSFCIQKYAINRNPFIHFSHRYQLSLLYLEGKDISAILAIYMHGRKQAKIQTHIENVQKPFSRLTILLSQPKIDGNYSYPMVFYPMGVFTHIMKGCESY